MAISDMNLIQLQTTMFAAKMVANKNCQQDITASLRLVDTVTYTAGLTSKFYLGDILAICLQKSSTTVLMSTQQHLAFLCLS